jgi:acyl carrier protein
MPIRTEAEIVSFLASAIEEVTLGAQPAADVGPATHILDDTEVDSLDFATIVLMTEEWLGIQVGEDDVDWTEVATIGALARFLGGHQADVRAA